MISIVGVKITHVLKIIKHAWEESGGGGGGRSHTSVLLPTQIHPLLKWTLNGISHHVTFAPLNGSDTCKT